ncbi:MAG TPA: hypothetical protein VI409_13370 [Gaiellaceae bacterium]|nr:hypothetical protein [Gaiellaceae bacterium]
MPHEPTPLYLVFDGAALEGLLYRIVAGCPPDRDDFRSYEALNKPYNRRDFFKGVGVSMHTTRERSLATLRRFGSGRAIATLDLRGQDIAWARTGGASHVTVWAPPELLMRHVLQCERHD